MGVLPASPLRSADSKEETWPRLSAHKTAEKRLTLCRTFPEGSLPESTGRYRGRAGGSSALIIKDLPSLRNVRGLARCGMAIAQFLSSLSL